MNSKKTEMLELGRRTFLAQATGAAGLLVGTGLNGSFNILRAAKTDAAGATANTVYGKLKGGAQGGGAQGKTLAFKGIPYGASTEGAGRFQPPTKPASWTGVREALELGPASPQVPSTLIPESMAQQPKGDANGSEDCLHLNVWTNSLKGNRPVMVWFHGGGYSAGSSNWNMYNGGNLAAKHDVVVVTVTHRLNVFGYLYLAELGGDKFANSANIGMLDCVAALEWVRDNIANFGGDPKNVTIFGQSGGGGKVSTMMGMAPAKGLFHRAIAQSGSNVMGQPKDRATAGAKALMATLNVATVDELQKLPLQKLLEGMRATRGLNLSPVVDGKVIPAGPFDPVSSPLSGSVPFMVGSTETEITWNAAYKGEPIEEAELVKRVTNAGKVDEAAAKQLIGVYRKTRADWKPLQLWNLMGTDLSNFRTGTDAEADRRAIAERQAPVYKYYFQWYSPVRGGVLGSYHTLEIPFIFRNADICESMCGTGKDRYALEDKMSASWVAFARTGNPNAKGNPKWDPYTMDRRALMIWNNECKASDDPFKEERTARVALHATGAAA